MTHTAGQASSRGYARAYRGKMLYLTDGVEMGREYFGVTVMADGSRTLRAQCEMDDDLLVRDVVLTVDAEWRPQDAFVRLTIEQQLVGSTWYRFGNDFAEAEGLTIAQGRFSKKVDLDARAEALGTHSLHNDSWVVGRLRAWPGAVGAMPLATFSTSRLPNGGSGPDLIHLPPGSARILDFGTQNVTVAAGSFDTHHIGVRVPGVDDFDIWAGGEDCLPVRLSSTVLGQTYELVEISGDYLARPRGS